MKKCAVCGREYPDSATVCAADGQPLQQVTSPAPAAYPSPPSPYYRPRKTLAYIAPLRAGIVLGVMYAFFGLIFAPIFILAALFGKPPGASNVGYALPAAAIAIIGSLIFPVLYAIAGFIGGVIAAAIYNLVAKWTGGIEFEVRDVTPPAYYG